MSARRPTILAVLLAASVALSGCGAMPITGSVFAGEPADEAPQLGFEQLPDEPVAGASPQMIVEDFISAATSPASNYRIASMFLAPAAPWNPRESVQVVQGPRNWNLEEAETSATVTMTANTHAVVDAQGIYEGFDDASSPFVYRLERATRDDEWRIVAAPPGIVIEQAWFDQVYQPYSLYFFDPTMTFLVPDRRYFPSAVAAGRIAAALVAGPNPGLAPAVVTAFPEGTTLQEGSVVVDANVASLTFTDLPDPGDTTIGRMQAQMLASLRATNAKTLQMSLNAAPLSGIEVTASTPAVDTRAVVIKDGGLGYLTTGAEFTPFDGYRALASLQATSAVYQPGRETVVVRAGNGAVVRVPANDETITLDQRAGLVEPTLDPSGFVWTVPGADPSALRVSAPDGKQLEFPEGGIAGLSSVAAMQISRDGTRLAVIGTVDAHSTLIFVPVIRTANGTPTGLGAPVEVTALPGTGLDLAWFDDLTVGVLAQDGADRVLLSAVIGGVVSRQSVREGARFLSGVNAVASVRVLTEDEVLYTRRATTWQKVAEDVQVLGVLQVSIG